MTYNAVMPAYWPKTTSCARKFLSAKKPTRTNTSSILVDAKTTTARPIRVTSESICNEPKSDSLTSRQFRETVGAPAFAAHSVMHEEKAVRIVLVFHCE